MTEAQTQMPLFIEDGWTVKATISPKTGIHPGLAFSFRPMTWIERRKMAREQEAEKSEDKQDQIRAKQVASRLINWDSDIPVSTEAVMKLDSTLFVRLEAIVFGLDTADSAEVERKN